MSAWLLVGLSGQAFLRGISTVWVVIGCLGGTLFNLAVLSKRIREFSGRFGLLTVPVVGVIKLGGINTFMERLSEVSPSFFLLTEARQGLSLYLTLILGSLAIGLGYLGQLHILSCYMAIKEPKNLRYSGVISLSWLGLVLSGAVLIGLFKKAYSG